MKQEEDAGLAVKEDEGRIRRVRRF